MILLYSGKDSIHTNTSKGKDVIMTSLCIYGMYFFIRTAENTNGIKGKIISFKAFSVPHFKETTRL